MFEIRYGNEKINANKVIYSDTYDDAIFLAKKCLYAIVTDNNNKIIFET